MNRHAFCISIYNKVFKFRKWFKYGLKAQKFQKQHALNQRSPARSGIENRWPKGKAKVKGRSS
mgnify:CR=1 FL=1